MTTVSFSVKMNGEPLAFFHPTRGIRQGDPLSPYLLILVTNYLSSSMENGMTNGHIKGIKLNRFYPTLNHLLFADDSIFFLNGTIQECENVSTVLNQYCYASGQAINLNKSGIFFSKGCPQMLRDNMARTLRIQEMNHTGKYFGIPSYWGESKR